MVTFEVLVILAVVANPLIIIALNILKWKNKSKSLKIAFFHPFWYLFYLKKVMMVVEGKRSFGAFLMLFYNLIKKITFNLQFTVWLKTKMKSCKKLK